MHRAVDEKLTAKQRMVFVAMVLKGMPTDVLADQLGATHNAIYKMMFDARRKLRTALVDAGYLPEQQIGMSNVSTALVSICGPTRSMGGPQVGRAAVRAE